MDDLFQGIVSFLMVEDIIKSAENMKFFQFINDVFKYHSRVYWETNKLKKMIQNKAISEVIKYNKEKLSIIDRQLIGAPCCPHFRCNADHPLVSRNKNIIARSQYFNDENMNLYDKKFDFCVITCCLCDEKLEITWVPSKNNKDEDIQIPYFFTTSHGRVIDDTDGQIYDEFQYKLDRKVPTMAEYLREFKITEEQSFRSKAFLSKYAELESMELDDEVLFNSIIEFNKQLFIEHEEERYIAKKRKDMIDQRQKKRIEGRRFFREKSDSFREDEDEIIEDYDEIIGKDRTFIETPVKIEEQITPKSSDSKTVFQSPPKPKTYLRYSQSKTIDLINPNEFVDLVQTYPLQGRYNTAEYGRYLKHEGETKTREFELLPKKIDTPTLSKPDGKMSYSPQIFRSNLIGRK